MQIVRGKWSLILSETKKGIYGLFRLRTRSGVWRRGSGGRKGGEKWRLWKRGGTGKGGNGRKGAERFGLLLVRASGSRGGGGGR